MQKRRQNKHIHTSQLSRDCLTVSQAQSDFGPLARSLEALRSFSTGPPCQPLLSLLPLSVSEVFLNQVCFCVYLSDLQIQQWTLSVLFIEEICHMLHQNKYKLKDEILLNFIFI